MNSKERYYNKIYKKGKSKEWDQAPGKEVILKAYMDLVKPKSIKRVVEVGCGEGFLLNKLASVKKCPGADFIGVDISAVAVKRAKIKYPKIEFIQGDGADLKISGNSADIVVSYGAYEHFDNPLKGVSELSRILRPKGIFITMIPALGHYRDDRDDEGWYEDKGGQMQWNYKRETWERFFVDSRLKLMPFSKAVNYGAINPGVFFIGYK